MWFDRDVKKHAEQVIKMLRERGGLRLLGAVGSPDLADMISHLYESPTNFSPAVNYVLGEEALARQRNDALSDLRLLLYGGTGVGKTDFALSLAKLLGVPAEVLSLSAAQAAASLAGSEQHWSNTQPGIVWKQLIQDMHANPHDSWALSPGGLGARHFWRTFDYLLAEGRLQCIGKAAIGEASA